MKYRIAIWAVAGFLVASGWATYFATFRRDHPIEPIVSLEDASCLLGLAVLPLATSIHEVGFD